MFYYHLWLWEYFCLFSLFPSMAFTLGRLFFGEPNIFTWKNYRVREKYNSAFEAMSPLRWNYNKIVAQKPTNKTNSEDPNEKEKKIVLMGNNWDFLYKIYLLIGAIYYIADSAIKFYYFGFTVFTDRCRQAFFFHHVMTLIVFQGLWMLDYYPWFCSFPPSYHNALVAFPRLWINNYVYATALVCFVFCPLAFQACRENRMHMALIVRSFFLIIPIALMATAGECADQWDIHT